MEKNRVLNDSLTHSPCLFDARELKRLHFWIILTYILYRIISELLRRIVSNYHFWVWQRCHYLTASLGVNPWTLMCGSSVWQTDGRTDAQN